MPNDVAVPRRSWVQVVLRDEHFWIPLAVLIMGLVILKWVAGIVQ